MQPSHLLLVQTELAGGQPHNWPTFEASHEKHNLHQLCCPEHPRGRRRLRSAKHVLGILGISEHLPLMLRGSLCIFAFLWTANMKSSGGAGWSNAADSGGDVEQILLAGRSLPKDDGGERVP